MRKKKPYYDESLQPIIQAMLTKEVIINGTKRNWIVEVTASLVHKDGLPIPPICLPLCGPEFRRCLPLPCMPVLIPKPPPGPN